ncbi:HAD-IA family hydrolase [Streptomyces canus]|uniref:HAD family hydrolase n=1 Tax=Streptomyces canus TaxID=58343 RepID=UPI002E3689A1|nr:HAD-IA family hydrolase [Streptomyces canus]
MTDATDDQNAVLSLLTHAPAVLFDFDGPVCDLFRGVSTADVAAKVKQDALKHWDTLDEDVANCDDSHGILRHLRNMYDRSGPMSRCPLDLAERIVAEQEGEAVKSALRTPGIATLVHSLHERGKRLVVVSNNADNPIKAFLDQPGLKDRFEAVFGRDPYNAALMKPDPDCVHRALTYLDLPENAPPCLLVGDQLTDLQAARAAGTRFLGYTRDRSRARAMLRDGADAVVTSFAPVVAACRQLPTTRKRLSSAMR